MLYTFISLLLLVAIIDEAVLTSKCSVCINQHLLTSSVTCPVCKWNDIDEKRQPNTDGYQLPSKQGQVYKTIFGYLYNHEPDPDRTSIQRNLPRKQSCNSLKRCTAGYKYRSIDGSCNNLIYTSWGKSNTLFSRILPPYNQQSQFLSDVTESEEKLPLSRVLSTSFFPNHNTSDDTVNLIVIAWGQLIAHDITYSTLAASFELDCCSRDGKNLTDKCIPIYIPKDDYFYSQYNVTCFSTIRGISGCGRKSYDKVNGVTHYMDASQVYGSDLKTANGLRAFQGGRLKTQTSENEHSFLPNVSKGCYPNKSSKPCYSAGDIRVNQNPLLAILQTLLLREHNRIVKKLEELHPDWDDETLYQEGRSILIAVFQHINYKEWLVHFVGERNMKRHKLYPKRFGYTTYNSRINAMTTNSFTAAAFRAAHTGIPGFFRMLNYNHALNGTERLTDWLNRPYIIQENENYDSILLGLVNQNMDSVGCHSAFEVQNLMFNLHTPYGKDLFSIDIAKGRDHAIAPYINYLEICTGYKARTFDDLEMYIDGKFIDKLKLNYNKVEDIELFIGGILETKVKGARFGPTLLCIITEQFYRKKWGDRFWYEVGEQPHSFTGDQLQEIRKASLSRLLCDNSDNISKISMNSFLPPSKSNRVIDCSNIESVDLSKWG